MKTTAIQIKRSSDRSSRSVARSDSSFAALSANAPREAGTVKPPLLLITTFSLDASLVLVNHVPCRNFYALGAGYITLSPGTLVPMRVLYQLARSLVFEVLPSRLKHDG